MKRRSVELFVFLGIVTILTPLLQSMGIPWILRVVIYLVPYGIILLYHWLTGAATDWKRKADEELVRLLGSVETVNALRTKYPALEWFFRNQDSKMIVKIAVDARDSGLLTAEQVAGLRHAADQWAQHQ
jgi:hypothetical protein